MAIGNVVRPAGRQDRGDPTLGGDGLVSAGKTVKGRSITAEMRSLTAYANRPSPVPQGPVTRDSWWLPDPAEGGTALELQEAVTQSILPAYQHLVLEAPSTMERVAGEMLIQGVGRLPAAVE